MTNMTRRQLYDLIWSKPMRDAAAEIGISDVGLKKVCVRHRVPVPPQGYWNKVHAGQSPRKALFREIDDTALDCVSIAGAYYKAPPEVRAALAEAKIQDKASGGTITVDASSPPSLPAAVQLATALKNARPDGNGLVHAAGPHLFQVAVAPESVDRAVAIVETLLRAAAEHGFVATPGEKSLALQVDAEAVLLSLTEQFQWVPRELAPQEVQQRERKARAARSSYGELHSFYRPDPAPGAYRGTGLLCLEAEKEWGVRCRWRDTKMRRLESLLNRVLVDLVVYAAATKQRREEHERRQRQWRLEEQQRHREEVRTELLTRQLKAFEEMSRLDRYLASMTADLAGKDPPRAVQTFLNWVRQRAAALHHRCSVAGLQHALRQADTLFDDQEEV